MKVTVVILKDTAAEIESGRRFYEMREPGLGEYFVESILLHLRRATRDTDEDQ